MLAWKVEQNEKDDDDEHWCFLLMAIILCLQLLHVGSGSLLFVVVNSFCGRMWHRTNGTNEQ